MLFQHQKNKSTIFIVIVCLILNGCASRSASSPKIRHFSAEEDTLGVNIHQQMLSNFYLYTEPTVIEYVNEVSANLTGATLAGHKAYEVYLLHNEKIYAKSAPGGYIYLTTGMINFLENEAELAAIIAKEIGVLQFQKPELNQNKKILDQSAQAIAGIAPIFGIFGLLVTLGVAITHPFLKKRLAPEDRDRLVSDKLAMKYMVAAGYDPQGFIDVMHRFIQSDQSSRPYFHDYYMTNPITEERFIQMNEVFSKLPISNRSLSVNHASFIAKTHGIREIYRIA
jgi:predicted Zn-dependent protease